MPQNSKSRKTKNKILIKFHMPLLFQLNSPVMKSWIWTKFYAMKKILYKKIFEKEYHTNVYSYLHKFCNFNLKEYNL